MKLFKVLEKLRSKPDHFKKIFSLLLTVVIFAGIVFVWFSSLDARMSNKETLDKTVSPLEGVTSVFGGLVAGFKESMSGTPSFIENGDMVATATSTDVFDLSGIVVLDHSSTTIK